MGSLPFTPGARASLVLAVAIVGGSHAAFAQSAADAERLFQDGRTALQAGRIAEACQAFDASYRAEQNVSTLMNLADCREKNAQLATAWAQFVAAANQTAGRSDRIKMHAHATAEAAALEGRLSYLIINVADDSRIDGLVITRNGVTIDPGAWNRALPIDGGSYAIVAKAPGHEPWSASVTVAADSDRRSVDVPRFTKLPAEPPPSAVARPAGTAMVDDTVEPATAWRRPVAVGAAGLGVLAIAGAVVLEISARGKYDDSVREVDDVRQRQLYDSAVTRRYAAQASVGIGIASIATGVWLWLSDRSPHQITPAVTSSSAGVAGVF